MKYLLFISVLFVNLSFSQSQDDISDDYVTKGNKAMAEKDYIGAHYFYTKSIETSSAGNPNLHLNHLFRMNTSYSKNDYLGVLRESKETLNVFMKISEDIGYGDNANNEKRKEWYKNIAYMFLLKAMAIESLENNNLDYDKSEHCSKCDNVIQALYYDQGFRAALSRFNCNDEDIDNWGKICLN
jgi:hypothetical protein